MRRCGGAVILTAKVVWLGGADFDVQVGCVFRLVPVSFSLSSSVGSSIAAPRYFKYFFNSGVVRRREREGERWKLSFGEED